MMNVLRFLLTGLVLLAVTASGVTVGASEPLVVHEWGTFTSLQSDDGVELTGINVDDEPVPHFVHNLHRLLLGSPVLSSLHWRYRQKGAPARHPLVTMRLETPVVYFYPPKNAELPMSVDVNVQFRGGWLTEFYPNANATAEGLKQNNWSDFGNLHENTHSSLGWKNLQIGGNGKTPQTDEVVWTAPRQTQATPVATPAGEAEKYLFYRGIGHIKAPLKAVRGCKSTTLYANFNQVMGKEDSVDINHVWFVDIRDDGAVAFKTLPKMTVTGDPEQPVGGYLPFFGEDDYSKENLGKLQEAMHAGLTDDGLFGDEATALLKTWERAYFQAAGQRLFYLVPRVWTDHYLPLEVSRESHIERVMVGRLEVITPQQYQLLEKIATGPISDGRWVENIKDSEAAKRFFTGHSDFPKYGDLGVEIPADYQAYLDLGRFRNALVVWYERDQENKNITQFMDTYKLGPFRVRVKE